MEERLRIIEKCIETGKSVEETKEYLKLLSSTPNQRVFETSIGVMAEKTDVYKTIMARCSELGLKTIGDLVRYGGRAMRVSGNVGAKTAAVISDALQSEFGIDNWFSKEMEASTTAELKIQRLGD